LASSQDVSAPEARRKQPKALKASTPTNIYVDRERPTPSRDGRTEKALIPRAASCALFKPVQTAALI
jgi:hypothetical protein